tara:strand:- start:141 stop:563 length:423 start_codon:yes stop_codon:yes gene_type:complete
MNDKYKIIAKYIKDMSSETPDIDTYLFVKDNLSNYALDINIQSKALKEKIIQVETTLNYSDKNESNKKSLFQMVYATVIRVNEETKNKNDIAKIVLVDVQNEIYPELEKAFLNIMHGSGYEDLKFTKKINFDELYENNKN